MIAPPDKSFPTDAWLGKLNRVVGSPSYPG